LEREKCHFTPIGAPTEQGNTIWERVSKRLRDVGSRECLDMDAKERGNTSETGDLKLCLTLVSGDEKRECPYEQNRGIVDVVRGNWEDRRRPKEDKSQSESGRSKRKRGIRLKCGTRQGKNSAYEHAKPKVASGADWRAGPKI